MSSIPQSTAPTPPTHLPPALLYHCHTTSTSQITPTSPHNLIHHSTPPQRPPKRLAAARALHTLSTAYVPALLADEIDHPDGSPGPEAKAVDTKSNIEKPASPSSASSTSDFTPTSIHSSLVSRRLARRKRAGRLRTKNLPSPSSSASSSMSDSAPESQSSTTVHRRLKKGKRIAVEERAGGFRSMKRNRRGEKLDRDDMKVIAGTSVGNLAADERGIVAKHGSEETLGPGKVET